MTDVAFDLILDALVKHPEDALWLADENAMRADILPILPNLNIVTNRFDLFESLTAKKANVTFSDFDLTGFADDSLNAIYLRVPKEKAIAHHIINEAGRLLKEGGKLHICGLKQEGTKTYIDKAKKYLYGEAEVNKSGPIFYAVIEKDDELGKRLDDKDYATIRPVAKVAEHEYLTKPGVFGWDKVDQGSTYLIDHLPEFIKLLKKTPASTLDLGCGYGYLSIQAHLAGYKNIVATDNNAGAIIACEANFKALGIDGAVVTADCANNIKEKFDLILCNPPFHQGFSVEGGMTEHFIKNIRNRLAPGGVAALVVNQFVPLESKSKGKFSSLVEITRNKSFKLIALIA
jgi:16S rRNA (guanine1207-N2)-methyltransferase